MIFCESSSGAASVIASSLYSPKKLCILFVPFDGVDGSAFLLWMCPRIVAVEVARWTQYEGIRNVNVMDLKFPGIFWKE